VVGRVSRSQRQADYRVIILVVSYNSSDVARSEKLRQQRKTLHPRDHLIFVDGARGLERHQTRGKSQLLEMKSVT
jgi:hypothetical protein